ncbi:hypothetical protein CCACVL1_14715 [Corchorus capsularis]|uniref:DUF4283 domain-containing protein n=1 Tax=Corchorus capsularis TaxID=210143 RepID=A0A1R3I5Z7_COCAP|nr:hypothetical protein CCACVL1_14715 [Corchorus capsularis]
MAGALSNLCSKMSLQEDGRQKIVLEQEWFDETEGAMSWFYIIGKLFSKWQQNVEVLQNVMAQASRVVQGFQVKEVGDRLFVFQFKDDIEKDIVLVNQPWNFNKALLALNDYDGFLEPENVIFDTTPFWVRAYGLPLRMMNEKVGIAVGEAMGPVLEVDEDWGLYLRIRIQVNILQSLLDDIVISTPNGDAVVEFYYEQLPDYCWVCGLVDHQETDCPVVVVMRQSQGRVVKKYSRRLKAETLNLRSTRGPSSESSQGSHRRGALGPSVLPVLRARMADNCVPNRDDAIKSTTGIGVDFRNHVDSMLLRGKQVARAVTYEEASCEIISRMEARNVEQVPHLQGNQEKVGNVEGDKAVNRGLMEGDVEESSGETPSTVAAKLLEKNLTCSCSSLQIKKDSTGPIMNQEIPGIGLPALGPLSREVALAEGDMGSTNLGLESDAAAYANPVGNHNTLKASKNLASNVDSYDPSSPFIFGAGSSGVRKVRKRKKAVKVSEEHSCDLLCHEPLMEAGSKRSNVLVMLQESVFGGSNVKRSRESAMDIETHGETGSENDDVAVHAVAGISTDNVEAAEVAEDHLCRGK